MYEITKKDIKYCDFVGFSWCGRRGLYFCEDAKQEGRLGMIIASGKYDPEKGRFWAYATFWVHRKLNDFFYNGLTKDRKTPQRSEIYKNCFKADPPRKIAGYKEYTSDDEFEYMARMPLEKHIFYSCESHEDLIANIDLIEKCFKKMPEHLKEALYQKAYNDIDYSETSKKYGMNEKSISALICQWRDAWIYGKPIYKKYLCKNGRTERALGNI